MLRSRDILARAGLKLQLQLGWEKKSERYSLPLFLYWLPVKQVKKQILFLETSECCWNSWKPTIFIGAGAGAATLLTPTSNEGFWLDKISGSWGSWWSGWPASSPLGRGWRWPASCYRGDNFGPTYLQCIKVISVFRIPIHLAQCCGAKTCRSRTL